MTQPKFHTEAALPTGSEKQVNVVSRISRARAPTHLVLAVAAATLLANACSDGDPDVAGSTLLPSDIADANAGSELQQAVQLDGRYVAQIRIEDGGAWRANRAQQEIALTLTATGLTSVRQVEFVVKPTPVSAFDLASAVFTPAAPLRTLGVGVEVERGTQIRAGAATLTEDVVGDRVLGTLTLKTSTTFNALTKAQLGVVFVSVGPSVSDRENFEEEDLNLGVIVN